MKPWRKNCALVVTVVWLTTFACATATAPEVQEAGLAVDAWNDECGAVWDESWGGGPLQTLLDPRIGQLQEMAGIEADGKYLEDMRKWLGAVLKPESVPVDLLEHVVAVKSHILLAADPRFFAELAKVSKLSALDIETTDVSQFSDTSGLIVRYETEKYIILVVDRAMDMAIVVRSKTEKADLKDKEKRIAFLWDVLADLFVEELWKPRGEKAYLTFLSDPSGSQVHDAALTNVKREDGEWAGAVQLTDHFTWVRLTLPPGPVVRAVLVKRLPSRAKEARLFPGSRFEEMTLFEYDDKAADE